MAAYADIQEQEGSSRARVVRRVGRDELEMALTRVLEQGCSELVLLGPGAWEDRRASAEEVPGRVVFQVRARSIPSVDFRALGNLRTLAIVNLAIDDGYVAAMVGCLKQLRGLDLSWNSIGDAGATEIGSNLKQLTSLDLSVNSVGDAGVAAIARNLVQLTALDLRANNVGSHGATEIGTNLKQLTFLDLGVNSIGEAGTTAIAAQLRELRSLKLDNNAIGETGAIAIATNFKQLTALDLARNTIGDAGVAAIATDLQQLTSLHVGWNGIGIAGARAIAAKLNQLISLDLRYSGLGDTGAAAIAIKLNQLTSLNLSNNDIGDAGAAAIATKLNQLTSLNISGNRVGDGGAMAIATRLRQLTSLDVHSNGIGDVGTTAIATNLTQLRSLHVGHNCIGDGGAAAIATHLRQLTSLDIGHNAIGDGGAAAIATHLNQLTFLDVGHNAIGEVGATAIATHLEQLTSLDLCGNDVGDVEATAIATHLKRLVSLNLGSNDVGDVVASAIAAHLRQLTYLDLSRSSVSNEAVDRLAALPAVVSLDLSRTAVTDISALEPWLDQGIAIRAGYGWRRGIFVRKCPLKVPTPEVVSQGTEAVLNYFRELRGQGSARLLEAKVMLLGEGGAGKTSLLRRLYLPGQPLPNEDQSTRGIEIHPQRFKLADGGEFRLNLWDFGGQQIYHATHQFFLTKNALYILVDDTRKDYRSVHDEGFKYWLEVVETFGGKSPLLVFQNEKGGRSKPIDESGIKGRFPNVVLVLRGDLAKPDAADGIRRAIEQTVQDLPHVGETVPAKWVEVRAAIEVATETKPYISQDEYVDIYNRILEPDRDKALHLSRYLHDLGVFLHFQDDLRLRKTVILQNRWATEAVFQVLDDEKVKSQLGCFDLSDCARVWHRGEYVDMHMELVALLERFELCYQLPDTSTWLIPQLLRPSTPRYVEGWNSANDLVLSYRYEFLPRGLVSRLMVRKHRLLAHPELSWSNGALFEHRDTQLLALTESNGSAITLRAKGPEKKALLGAIASSLDDLNSSFRGMDGKVRKWVPCVCVKCGAGTSPQFFDEERLVQRRRDGKLTVECPSSYDHVSVLELIDGVRLDNLPSWATDKDPPATESKRAATSNTSIPETRAKQNGSLGWLHLSDLHQGIEAQRWLWPNLRDKLFEDLEKTYKKSGPWDVVFFTGDLTQKGRQGEFEELNQTLEALWRVFRTLGCNPTLLSVPGNHDLERPNPKSPLVKALTPWNDPEVISEFWDNESGDYRKPVADCFSGYRSWLASHPFPKPATKRDGLLPGEFSAGIERDGLRFGVVGLNSAFLHLTNGNYEGRLALDPRQLHAACEGDGVEWAKQHDFCFLLTHHPPQWLSRVAQQALQGEIAPPGRFGIHLFGHMHESRSESRSIGGAPPWRRWQGSSLFGLESWGENIERTHGYSAGRLQIDACGQNTVRLWPRVASKSTEGVWRIGPDNREFELLEDGGTAPETCGTGRERQRPSPNIWE